MYKQIQLIKPCDKKYPNAFIVLNKKPDIYFIGEIENKSKKVGIIGSRRPTTYGLRFTNELSSKLAKAKIDTVSGFARGIDSCCHKATLQAGGKTIAILGSGIDIVYPPENRYLYELTIREGAIISEFKPGTPPFKQNFPIRNRLISALCDLLVVVEASKKSGTLITVDYALEQGKEVMVLPGSIFSKQSQGTNNLIKQGAEPITSIDNVLEKLNIDINLKKDEPKSKILQLLNEKSMDAEEIAAITNKSISEITIELSRLQIKGYIKEDFSGKFYRIK